MSQQHRYRIHYTMPGGDKYESTATFETMEQAQKIAAQLNAGSAGQRLGAKYYAVDSEAEPAPPRHWARHPLSIALFVLIAILLAVFFGALFYIQDLRSQYLEFQTVPVAIRILMDGGAR